MISLFTTIDFDQDQDINNAYLPTDTVKLKTKLQPNDSVRKYIQIQRIFIIGNKITRDHIILRELNFKQGDYIDSTELPIVLDKVQKRIYNTRLFNKVSLRTLELAPGKFDVLIDVNERWYTFPSPRFDLSDRNFNEWWQNYDHDFDRVIYGLKLYQYNVRGRNETLLLKALFGFQRNFAIQYRMPYIDKKQKQGLIFNLEYSETKNLAYRTEGNKLVYAKAKRILKQRQNYSITYTYRNSFYQTHWIGVEYNNSLISDTVAFLNPNYFDNGQIRQKYFSLLYQFTSDHRDVAAYPLEGHHAILSIQKNGIGFGDDINKLETNFIYAKYIDLKKGLYFSNYSNLYWSTSNEQPYANFGAMGYQKQFVKGYEVYVIEGPHYFLNKSTLKKRLFSRRYNWKLMPRSFQHIPLSVYLKTYADLGYVKNYPYYYRNDFNNKLADKILAGVGGGIDIVASYDVVLRFEYTFNAEGSHGFFLHMKKEF